MYFCFCDETGTGDGGAHLIVAGIVADANRYSRTREEFKELFDRCSSAAKDGLRELKSSELSRGKGKWFSVPRHERNGIISELVEWTTTRKHRIALAAINVEVAAATPAPDDIPDDNWLRAGLHVALQVQRSHQGKSGNKGRTLLFFDEHPRLADLSGLLLEPPLSTDAYYGRRKKQAVLSEVLDTSVAVKSHHFGLIQVADLYAYIFRRYCELVAGASETWEGETATVTEWTHALAPRLLDAADRWPARTTSPLAKWYRAVAPRPLLDLG